MTNQIKTKPPDEILLINFNNGFLSNEYKIPFKLLDEYSESYGAGLYGLSNYPCNLSLVKFHKKRLNTQITSMCFFIGLLMLFAFLIPYIQKINNLALLKTVNTQIKSIKKDVSTVEKIHERITALDETITHVNNIREKYTPRLDVILELAKVLPNDAWAKAVTIAGNSFELEGDAVSSTNLIPTLESSPLFSGVGLSSPVTKTQSGREKFRIRGTIEKH